MLRMNIHAHITKSTIFQPLNIAQHLINPLLKCEHLLHQVINIVNLPFDLILHKLINTALAYSLLRIKVLDLLAGTVTVFNLHTRVSPSHDFFGPERSLLDPLHLQSELLQVKLWLARLLKLHFLLLRPIAQDLRWPPSVQSSLVFILFGPSKTLSAALHLDVLGLLAQGSLRSYGIQRLHHDTLWRVLTLLFIPLLDVRRKHYPFRFQPVVFFFERTVHSHIDYNLGPALNRIEQNNQKSGSRLLIRLVGWENERSLDEVGVRRIQVGIELCQDAQSTQDLRSYISNVLIVKLLTFQSSCQKFKTK